MATKRPAQQTDEAATYTTLLPEHVVKGLVNVVDGAPLRHVLSRSNKATDFSSYRIGPGDTLIALHVHEGRVCPIARMRVIFKGTVGAWNALHADERYPGHDLKQLLVGDQGTPMHFARPLPDEIVRALRYDAKKEPRALKVRDDGRLAQATGIDGVFRLTRESADELLSLSWI